MFIPNFSIRMFSTFCHTLMSFSFMILSYFFLNYFNSFLDSDSPAFFAHQFCICLACRRTPSVYHRRGFLQSRTFLDFVRRSSVSPPTKAPVHHGVPQHVLSFCFILRLFFLLAAAGGVPSRLPAVVGISYAYRANKITISAAARLR